MAADHGSAAQPANPEAPQAVSNGPLQAKLAVPLETRRTQAGTPVLASVLVAWTGGDCHLKAGATVEGHVVAVESLKDSRREASLAVAFEKADCNGQHDLPMPLLLVGLIRVEQPQVERQAAYYPGLFSSGNGGPHGGGVPSAGVYTGVGTMTRAVKAKAPSGPATIVAGQVVGLKKVALGVGTGPAGASVVHSDSHDIKLDTQVELILTPVAGPPNQGEPKLVERAENEPVVDRAVAPKAPAAEPDASEVCAASDCDIAEGMEGPAAAAGASQTMPLVRFGYSLRSYLRRGFDQDTTISYLSATQVLVTFDPHRLRVRSGVWPEVERRPIRAILMDAKTGAVERVLDWMVDGTGTYLWPAGPGRVLVHMGGALQVLGPDLKPSLRVSIDSDLLWVASSPSGDAIVFALLRERHTRETHAFLRERTGIEPEEDVEVRLIDRTGSVQLTRMATSVMKAPVLTDGGEVVVRQERRQRWLLREEKDASGKDAHTIAEVNSACEPEVTGLLQDAVFVAGCNDNDHWYRVVRSSGRTMLVGRGSPLQMEQGAAGGEAGVYAIRVVRSKAPLGGALYEAKDLAEERVGVYRTADGKQLLQATTQSFPEASRNFALCPDGRQLALLTRTGVQFYAVAGARQ